MSKVLLCYFLFGLLGALVTGCSREETHHSLYPLVFSIKEVPVSTTGALFQARVVIADPSDPIVQHGFEWFTLKDEGNVDKVYLGSLSVSGRFESAVSYGFDPDNTYQMRPFVITQKYTVYGEGVTFKGAGGSNPTIASLTPQVATWLDTLIIKGKNFSFVPSKINASFGDISAKVAAATDTLIKVIVPLDLLVKDAIPLKVSVGRYSTFSSATFSLLPMTIDSISPPKGGSGTHVTIAGHHFHPQNSYLLINNVEVVNSKLTKERVEFTLPAQTPGGSVKITVKAGTLTVSDTSFFRTYPIVKEIIPNQAFYGDTILVKGDYLGSTYPDNEVRFPVYSNSYATILEKGVGYLKIIIPILSPTPSSIKPVVFADAVEGLSAISFSIFPPQVTSVAPVIGLLPGQAVTIKGKNFHPWSGNDSVMIGGILAHNLSVTRDSLVVAYPTTGSHTNNITIQISGHQFNPAQITSPCRLFQTNPVMPFDGAFSTGSMGYVMNGTNLYSINPTSGHLTLKQTFPGQGRTYGAAYSFNGNGYLLGGYGYTNDPLTDDWEYRPDSDKWVFKTYLSFHAADVTIINGKAVALSNITYGPNSIGYTGTLLEHDDQNDTWNSLAKPLFNLDSYNTFTFQIGSEYFVGTISSSQLNYFFSKYNRTTDQWTSLGSTPFGSNRVVSFTFKGKGMVIVGDRIYTYDPIGSTWTKVSEGHDLVTALTGNQARLQINGKWYVGAYRQGNSGLSFSVVEFDESY